MTLPSRRVEEPFRLIGAERLRLLPLAVADEPARGAFVRHTVVLTALRGYMRVNQCCGRVQATSYCDTLFGFFEFCSCSPAYFVPAVPSGLNADPGAEIEWPGWFGVSSQLAFGWPVARVVAAARVVVGALAVVVATGLDAAGMLARAAACPPMGAAILPPANAAAEASDNAHSAVIVIADFSFRVLMGISSARDRARLVEF